MRTNPGDRGRFDRWSGTYDQDASTSTEFPLAGYDRVLADVVSQAEARSSMSVLDLGTGTGNLASLFHNSNCTVWATDFSPGMIAQARKKYPGVEFAIATLQDSPPDSFPSRYDRVVSAYTFHHLELNDKVALIRDLVADHLLSVGRLVIADVSFATAEDRLAARSRFADLWDSGEHYWAAEEIVGRLQRLDLEVTYTQASFCAGIYLIKRKGDTRTDG